MLESSWPQAPPNIYIYYFFLQTHMNIYLFMLATYLRAHVAELKLPNPKMPTIVEFFQVAWESISDPTVPMSPGYDIRLAIRI